MSTQRHRRRGPVENWSRHGRFSGVDGVMAMTHSRAPAWTGIVFRRAVLDALGPPDREARGPSGSGLSFCGCDALALHYQ